MAISSIGRRLVLSEEDVKIVVRVLEEAKPMRLYTSGQPIDMDDLEIPEQVFRFSSKRALDYLEQLKDKEDQE